MILWTAILYFFLQGIAAAEDCSITEIPGTVLGCALKDEQLNIGADKNVTVPTDTTCIFEDETIVNHIICDASHWKIKETIRKQRNVRRKRGFWRRVGNFFKEVVKGVICVATLFSCLWDGRAGDVDRTPPGMICVPPLIPAEAEPYQTYAKVTWTEPTAHDETDGKIIPTRRSGRAPGRHFPRGNTTVTYEAKDRSANKVECSITISVRVIECDRPTNLENGYFQCHPVTEFLYGGGCRFGCYEGFDLHGSDSIECQKNGQWSKPQPVCKPWECPTLPSVDGAGEANCTKKFSFRSICSYNCGTGFDMPPKVSKAVVCDKTKTWRKNGEPMCIDVEPPVFATCPSTVVAGTDTGVNSTKVNWKEPVVSDNSNTAQRYMKHGVPAGSRLTAGMYTIQYGAKDAGGNSAIRDCTFKVIVREIRCPKLYPTPFVHISCPDGYRSGARCNISCDPGKILFGSDNVGCNKSPRGLFGVWNWNDAQQSICKNGKNCITMTPPKNGAIACDNWEGGQFCQVQCRNGTEMASVSLNTLYVCDVTGSWSKPPLKSKTCREVRRQNVQHTLGISAFYYFNGDCTDPSTQQQIANNFIAAIKADERFQPEACPDNSNECNPRNVQIFCGESSRRRRETLNSTHQIMDIEIAFRLAVTADDAESLFMVENRYQLLLEHVTDVLKDKQSNIFVGTTVSLQQLTSTGLKIHCPKGSVQSEQSFSCIDCPEGTYYANRYDSVVCEACMKGTFQDDVAQTMCNRCPFGKTTHTIGASLEYECEDSCMPGSYSEDGILPCSPCEQGHYQSSHGQTSCHGCRDSKTTLTFGAVSASDCEDFDMAFVPEEQSEVRVALQGNVTIAEFTVSFWLRQSTLDISNEDSFPSVMLSDKHGGDLWIWENMRNVKHHNNMNIRVDFGLPDSRWHQIVMHRSETCNISVSVDGMYLPVEAYYGRCTDITFNTLTVSAANGTSGSISQLNIWHGKHNMGYSHRCFSREIGDVVSWKQFDDAEHLGAYIQIPSECDDFDNCVSSPCLYGTCNDDLHGFICTCRQGYSGTRCDINIDDCETSICMNSATCVDGVADYTCSCPASYTGQYCEIEMVDGEWSDWGPWSECSTTCGDGENKRKRLCNNPTPDNGGELCVGDLFDFKQCNSSDCPVCPPISAPVNGSLDCFNDTDSINCTVYCNDGFDFDIEPLPRYHCGSQTFQEWNYQTDENPDRRLPRCIAIKLPEELKVQYSAYYKDLYCANTALENIARKQIELVVKSMLLNVPCVVKRTCRLDYVDVNNCDAKNQQRRSMNTAGFTLQITSNPTEDNTNETLTDLENAFQDIQGAADNGEFIVDVLDDDFDLDANLTDLSGEVVCGPGETRVKFYCVPCGQGAYLWTDYCKSCPIGTYQDTEEQSSCNNCPEGKSTVGIRSISLNDCTVVTVVPLEEGLKVTGIIVGCVSAVVAIAIASFGYRRYKSKIDKLVEPTHIAMTVRSATSMTSNAGELGQSKKIFETYTLNTQSSTVKIRHTDSDSEEKIPQELDTTGKDTRLELNRSCTSTTADGQVVHCQPW